MNKIPANLITLPALDAVASRLVTNRQKFSDKNQDASVLWDAMLETWRQDMHGFFVYVPEVGRTKPVQDSTLHRWVVWVIAQDMADMYRPAARMLNGWVQDTTIKHTHVPGMYGTGRMDDMIIKAIASITASEVHKYTHSASRISLLGSLEPILPDNQPPLNIGNWQ